MGNRLDLVGRSAAVFRGGPVGGSRMRWWLVVQTLGLVASIAVQAPLSLDAAPTIAGVVSSAAVQLIQEQDAEALAGAAAQNQAEADSVGFTAGRPAADYIGPSYATITWPAPPVQLLNQPASRNIIGYSVAVRRGEQKLPNVEVEGSTALSARLGSLMPNTKYSVSVLTKLSSGSSTEAGPATTFRTAADAPGVVAKPIASNVRMTSVTLNWSAPSDGGSAIQYYKIEKQMGGSGDFSPLVENGVVMEDTGDAKTSRIIHGLRPGTKYSFVVQAVNKIGTGPMSTPSDRVTTIKTSPPAAPGQPAVSQITANKMTLTWQPADSQGSSISGYQVFAKTSSQKDFYPRGNIIPVHSLEQVDGKLSTLISNLKPGMHIQYKIRASSNLGFGALSQASAQRMTDKLAPAAPKPPTVDNVTTNSAHLTWVPPDDNGEPITGYNLYEQKGSNGGFIEIAKGLKTTVYDRTGLEHAGTAYQWKVQAMSALGRGKMSPSSSTITTEYDKAEAASQVIRDREAVRTFSEVHNRMEEYKYLAAEAETAARKAKNVARIEARGAKKYRGMLEKSRDELARAIQGFNQKSLLQKKASIRSLAIQQKSADAKLAAQKAAANEELKLESAKRTRLRNELMQLKVKLQNTDQKKEEYFQKIRKMRKQGCKAGIRAWCMHQRRLLRAT